jgi:hypothetical protein
VFRFETIACIQDTQRRITYPLFKPLFSSKNMPYVARPMQDRSVAPFFLPLKIQPICAPRKCSPTTRLYFPQPNWVCTPTEIRSHDQNCIPTHNLLRLRLVRRKITGIGATGKNFPGDFLWWNFLCGRKKEPPPPVFPKPRELLAKITKNFPGIFLCLALKICVIFPGKFLCCQTEP